MLPLRKESEREKKKAKRKQNKAKQNIAMWRRFLRLFRTFLKTVFSLHITDCLHKTSQALQK
jgi:hypothetical protein